MTKKRHLSSGTCLFVSCEYCLINEKGRNTVTNSTFVLDDVIVDRPRQIWQKKQFLGLRPLLDVQLVSGSPPDRWWMHRW